MPEEMPKELLLPETDMPPLPQSLAVNYAGAAHRDAWLALFALDAHLANLVRQATEPLLGQMRLAWWRDRLNEAPSNWPKGNPLLALIGKSWGPDADGLVHLVDGWEFMLVEPPLAELDVTGFAKGRGQAVAALGKLIGADSGSDAVLAGERWALADLAMHTSDADDRAKVLDSAAQIKPAGARLPPVLRPLAVLNGLAQRAIDAGGAPLFSGRRAALYTLRLGLFGR